MPIQTTRALSPLKGVNRAFSREAQPDGTCWDAVNVLPQDRYGRLRVAQRSGLGQLATLDGANPVRLLHVASSSRVPGSAAITFARQTNPEQLTDFEADAMLHPGVDAGTVYNSIRGPGSTFSFPEEANTPTMNKTELSNFGDGTYGLRQSSSTLFAGGPIYGYYLIETALGNSASWLAASDSVWIEAYMHFEVQDADSGVITSPVCSIFLGIPMSEAQFTGPPGADIRPLMGFGFAGGSGTIDTSAFAWDGTTFPTMTQEITPTSYPYTNGTTYKLIVIATATTLYLYVDDFSTMTLIDQYAMPTGFSVANIIDGTVAVSVQSTKDTATAYTGPNADTVQRIAAYQAQSAPNNISRTALQLIGVTGTQTYIGDPTSMVEVANDASYPIDATQIFLSAATLFNYTYIVDGTSIHRLNLLSELYETFTEDAGTAPTDGTIATAWRGRLVIAGTPDDPQNFFASRAGDPLDWDYSQEDPTAAFVGNAAQSGRIGQPIHALIPMSDDILVIGCEQSMWAVKGDIADGGAIDQVTNFAGISQSNSWTRGPDGSLYFVGPRGFFMMDPTASTVQEISQTAYPQFFQNINRSTTFINMIYDSDRYGIWIFVSPLMDGSSVQSIFYDFRFQGYWPQDWRNFTTAGPVQAIYWDGYGSDTRYPVLGGFNGTLFAFNLTNRTDNGGAIVGTVTLGPFHPAADGEAMLVGLTANFGELAPVDASVPDRWQTSVSLFSGKTAYDVTEGEPTSTALIGWGRDRRTKTMRQRLKGEWFTVMLSNAAASNYFSMESLELEFDVAGKNRRQR